MTVLHVPYSLDMVAGGGAQDKKMSKGHLPRVVSHQVYNGKGSFWGGFRESRGCSRETYPESCITEYTQYTKNTETNAGAGATDGGARAS